MDISSVGSTTDATQGSTGSRTLTADDFMTLLIAQLRAQDPFEPMSNEEMLSQVATIQQVQTSKALDETLQTLASRQEFASASAMIGKHVRGVAMDSVGTVQEVSGTVTAIHFGSAGAVYLELDSGTLLPMESVVEVQAPASSDDDEDEDGDEDTTPLTGDLDGDGAIDEADLAMMVGAYTGPGGNTSNADADLDGDGDVDADDFREFFTHWTGGAPDETQDPQPSADVTGDGTVDEADLAEMVTAYTGPDEPTDNAAADVDGDGDVDADDFRMVLDQWTGNAQDGGA